MKHIKIIIIVCCLCAPSLSMAIHTLNDLNYCLALIKLVDKRIISDEKKYAPKDVAQVHQGLMAYAEYVEVKLIRPGLLSFYRGNGNRVALSEKLHLKYQHSFIEHLDERYSEERLIKSYAPAIEACANESLPKGDLSYNKVVNALDTIKRMIKL